MPAFTDHLTLYMPGGGSQGLGGEDEASDIDKINENSIKIDDWAETVDAKLATVDSPVAIEGTNVERLSLAPPVLRDGLQFFATDTKIQWYRVDGDWVQGHKNTAFAEAAGTRVTSATAVNTITFPSGRFTVAPVVVANQITGGVVGVAYISSVTKDSFQLRAYTLGGGQQSVNVAWHAVQMTPTAAAG